MTEKEKLEAEVKALRRLADLERKVAAAVTFGVFGA